MKIKNFEILNIFNILTQILLTVFTCTQVFTFFTFPIINNSKNKYKLFISTSIKKKRMHVFISKSLTYFLFQLWIILCITMHKIISFEENKKKDVTNFMLVDSEKVLNYLKIGCFTIDICLLFVFVKINMWFLTKVRSRKNNLHVNLLSNWSKIIVFAFIFLVYFYLLKKNTPFTRVLSSICLFVCVI